MLKAFINIWRVPDLRAKVLFTLGMLAIYRIGFFIPLPGVNQESLRDFAEKARQGGEAAGNLMQFVSIFTGGALGQSTIFALGIMPYISAAIILQLLGTAYEPLKKLQKEGAAGRQKILEYTRYLTVALCLFQSVFWLGWITQNDLVYPEYQGSLLFYACGILGLTGGTTFLMWLGEQVDKYGIGSGASLIITAGIIAQMPQAIGFIGSNFSVSSIGESSFGPMTVVFLVLAFVVVVAGSVMITQGQRRIPIQQAKHTRGRKVYGGEKSYLPLRINHGGVMPIIFASSLLMVPTAGISMIGSYFTEGFMAQMFAFFERNVMAIGAYPHILLYVAMIYFFAYFWTTVQFNPEEVATNLRDHGSFIPGLRPGPRTAEYLETVMERVTYVGAGCLSVIAVVPEVVAGYFNIPFFVSAFLGGTGLLITVSVMLDLIQRIEANLLMRNYEGFMGASHGARGGRVKGRSG